MEKEKYIYIEKINGTDESGIVEVYSMKLLCICLEDESKFILNSIENLTKPSETLAVEFAEWLRTECNCFDSSPQWYYLNNGENSPKTSEELYQIFLNR